MFFADFQDGHLGKALSGLGFPKGSVKGEGMVTYIVLVNVLSRETGNRISIEDEANLATSGVKSWSWHAGAAFKVLSIDIISFP